MFLLLAETKLYLATFVAACDGAGDVAETTGVCYDFRERGFDPVDDGEEHHLAEEGGCVFGGLADE